MNKKLVCIAGMPRSGSMWSYNVTRRMLIIAGREVLPDRIPKSDEEMMACARKGIESTEESEIYVLKVHAMLNMDSDKVFYISTVRDVRDALVSWMRFMHADFDMAVAQGIEMINAVNHYSAFSRDRLLRIEFKDVLHKPAEVCRKIAKSLDLDISDVTIDSVVEMYSKDNVSKIISAREHEILERLQRGDTIEQGDVVENYDRTVRAFDPDTGFQSGHVSNYCEGDWQTLLTGEQVRRINEVFGEWLVREGFEAG